MQTADLDKTATAVTVENGSESRLLTKSNVSVSYRQYQGEQDLPLIMTLVDNELSEPYSIFTYRYFLHSWPHLCWLAFDGNHCFGTVVSKQDKHGEMLRGYIAMLVVESLYRGLGVGTELVRRTISNMAASNADEVVLEAEVTNRGALTLYQNLGFIRDKYLTRYYLSGSDAFRLKLMLPLSPERLEELKNEQIAAEQLAQMRLQSSPAGVAGTAQQPAAEASHDPVHCSACREHELVQVGGQNADSKPAAVASNGSSRPAASQPKRKSKKSGKRAKG